MIQIDMASIIKKTYRKKRTFKVVDVGIKGRAGIKQYARVTTSENTGFVPDVHLELPSESAEPLDPAVVSSYSVRRTALEKGWDDIRKGIQRSHVESCEPGHKCSRCGDHVEETVVCFDCGPGCDFCAQCCTYLHTYVKFHVPMIWKVCTVKKVYCVFF